MKLKSLHIDHLKSFQGFDLNLTNEDGSVQDFVVIAGNNGSGKTTLLEFINERLDIHKSVPNGSNIVFDLTDVSWQGVSLGNNFKIEGINPAVTIIQYYQSKIGIVDGSALQNFCRPYMMKHVIYFDVSKPNIEQISKAIVTFIDKIIYAEGESAKNAYKKLSNTVKDLFSSLDLSINFEALDETKRIFFSNSNGETFDISKLSTGEQALLSKLLYFYLADVRDSIILIDEPELSLHPIWQSKIVELYQNLAKVKNNQIILATHSPQIIASTPVNSLFLLTWNENKIVINRANSYGMTVEKVLLSIMGSKTIRDPEIQKKYDEVENLITSNNFQSDVFKEKFEELEKLMVNDPIEFGLLRAEILRQERKNVTY